MSTVHLGRDCVTNQEVAIKIFSQTDISPHKAWASSKSEFLQQAESIKHLNHPNIVRIYATGEQDDLAYIIMERLHGHTLERYTSKSETTSLLPIAQLIPVVIHLLDALDYAHKNRVVHRDIKPANLMFDPTRQTIKITDFGIAQLTTGAETKTHFTQCNRRVHGTPYYMSPEQIIGQQGDGRSDLFSFGVVFYQLLTGHLPFPAREIKQLLLQICTQSPVDPRTLRPSLPPCLGEIIHTVLQKQAEKRYRTGADMAQDLANCLKG